MKPIVADYEAGMDAYNRNDYVAAYNTWRPLAEQGHADAQCMLGVLYDSGWGVPQDDIKSARWFRRAAERGNVDAQYITGSMYDDGKGVTQDVVEATRWYRMAAEQGDYEAQCELASGKGVLQDDAKAEYWFHIASEPARTAIRKCSTDAERLLKAVGEQALRRGLPVSLLAVLESDGMALTATQVADAAIATYHGGVLWVADREELCEQAVEAWRQVWSSIGRSLQPSPRLCRTSA